MVTLATLMLAVALVAVSLALCALASSPTTWLAVHATVSSANAVRLSVVLYALLAVHVAVGAGLSRLLVLLPL